MPEQIHPAERLLNLVIALVNTSARMTKDQIRTSVAGYGDAPSDDAFERMFERDKDTLRELGIPILTVTGAGHGDDIGYRIDQEAYALPAIDLTPAELGVLSLASQFWQDQSVRTDTTRALTKLRAVGDAPEAADLVAGLAPRVRAAGDSFGPLLEAIQARRVVTFTYRAASTGEVRARSVEPWRLLARRGGWFLVGHDRERGEARSFRLSRIEGPVRATGPEGAFDAPDADVLEAAMRSWSGGSQQIAVLAVRPERAEALRARALSSADDMGPAEPGVAAAPADRDVVRVPFTSLGEMAEEVLGYGDAVVVLAPAALRQAVVRLLRVAAGLHPASSGGPSDG
ncbi:helix-turn-helix transcriptional regulator [Cellulomonas timonensis]|uniref:helix-turn-helix transcriptional regulator n=1 Tax=Cellulomonas timonensis TaxID=1689271 RepID=UPI000833B7A4|nr:WYL domain-containing protein [Cellulomonas timonensis]